jgi:hypothetical protein
MEDSVGIAYHPLSQLDDRGRLFLRDHRVLRAIPSDYSHFYRSMLNGPLAARFFDHGLIRTAITELTLP